MERKAMAKKIDSGDYIVEVFWAKRGRKPNFLKELSIMYKEDDGKNKKFNNLSDAVNVVKFINNCINSYKLSNNIS